MVYKYKRKTNQAQWSEDVMMLAMAECNAGNPVKTTAIKYGLPYTTLYRHYKTGSSTAQLGRFRKVFNDQQEGDLRSYLQEMDEMFYGLTREEFKAMVYVYAKINNITYPQSWDKYEKAGDDWLAGFLSRNQQITLRVPEATSVARIKGFNCPQVERFYNLLNKLAEKYGIDGTRIYNVDETGIQTSTKKPPKVLSIKGKKQVGVVSSTERGQTTTIVCCCNAAGSFVPPFMIFARKRMQDHLLDGSPPETRGTCSPSGWINGEIFLEWLKFFVGHVRPTAEKKVLLLLDNHESHKYFPALDYAAKNNVEILSLPPHTSNKLQPLDVAVYGALKIYFEQEINRFQKAHPGRIVNQYDVARIFSPAYLKCATPNNAIKGFQSPGIWPINIDVWVEKDFAPSSTMMIDRSTANQEATCQETTNQNVGMTTTNRSTANQEATCQETTNQNVGMTTTKRSTANQEATCQETTNQNVGMTTTNDDVRASTSGLQHASQACKTLENIPADSSSDDDIELPEPVIVTAQVHNAMEEKSDLPTESCSGSIDPRGASPSIISELHEEAFFESTFTTPRSLTPDIQESSDQKANTSNNHVNSAIQNAMVDQHTALSMEIVSLADRICSTPLSVIKELNEKDPIISNVTRDICDLNIVKSNKKDPLKYKDNEIMPKPSTDSPVSYLSPREIRPLPAPHVPVGTRKRKIQMSEVLTSTPVKNDQKTKFIKTNTKVLKNINKDLGKKTKATLKKNTKTTKNTKLTKIAKTNRKATKIKKSKDRGNNEKYTCYFCGEDYIEINEQPVDDWIQCNSCKQWSHEKCTAYEGIGIYLCDNCTPY